MVTSSVTEVLAAGIALDSIVENVSSGNRSGLAVEFVAVTVAFDLAIRWRLQYRWHELCPVLST